jgi:hypothetical protein
MTVRVELGAAQLEGGSPVHIIIFALLIRNGSISGRSAAKLIDIRAYGMPMPEDAYLRRQAKRTIPGTLQRDAAE